MSHTEWPDLSDELYRRFACPVSHKYIYFIFHHAFHNLLHFISLCVVKNKTVDKIYCSGTNMRQHPNALPRYPQRFIAGIKESSQRVTLPVIHLNANYY